MSTALVKHEESLALSEVMTLGDVFKASGYFRDVRDQAQAVVKILYGRELGFSPVVSMMGVYIVDGKPSMASNLLASAVKRSGKYDYRVIQNTNTICEILFKCRDDSGKWEEIGTSSFTIEDAKLARVTGKDNWTKYPKAMLFARALSAGVRAHCPDVTTCPAYVPEELGVATDEEGNITEQAKPNAAIEPKKPISFKRESAAGNKPQDEQENLVQKGTPEPTSEAVETTVEVVESVPAPASTVEYIEIGKQKNFHIECRKAVSERRKMQADDLTYQWLMDNRYVDSEGKPTAAMIRADEWPAPRQKAVAWLKVQ